MIMWLMILGGTFALAIAGIIFLVTRVRKFSFIQRLFVGNRRRQLLASTGLVALTALMIGLCLGTMNLFIVVIYLMLIWLFCEGLFWLFARFFRRISQAKYYLPGIVALSVTFVYLGFGYATNRHVVVTVYTVCTDKEVEPLKIALISDSHIGSTFDGKGFGRYVEKINKLQPDLVVIAGDFIDGSSKTEEVLEAVRCLGQSDARYGTYFVFGNHDKSYYREGKNRELTTERFVTELEKNGVRVLEDDLVQIPGGYTVIGRKDKIENDRATIAELMEQVEQGSFTIDINHQPNDYANESAAGVDLVLSGHTHGGQLRLIRDVGIWIGANDKTYGYEKRGDTNFIVSSGISDWEIAFKTGCVSEIVLISVVPED